MPPDTMPRHRTPQERAAAESAALAVQRARAHTAPSFDPDVPDEDQNPSGHVTPAVAALKRKYIEQGRGER